MSSTGNVAVYLALGAVDLRGAYDRLAAVTRKVLFRQAWRARRGLPL